MVRWRAIKANEKNHRPPRRANGKSENVEAPVAPLAMGMDGLNAAVIPDPYDPEQYVREITPSPGA